MNTAPAIGADGTIYDISRAALNDHWGYLVAINPDLTPKWVASMREKFMDGCNVELPPNGTPDGCRAGAATGVDPSENLAGSGREAVVIGNLLADMLLAWMDPRVRLE